LLIRRYPCLRLNSFSVLSSSHRSPQSPRRWRERNSNGLLSACSNSASAPGVATICPAGNNGIGGREFIFVPHLTGGDGANRGRVVSSQASRRLCLTLDGSWWRHWLVFRLKGGIGQTVEVRSAL